MSEVVNRFYSHGKLLLTSEYTVLKGSKALALPLNKGQWLNVQETNSGIIEWTTYEQNRLIFNASFHPQGFDTINSSDIEKASLIEKLLKAALQLNPDALANVQGLKIETHINFNMNWGFGTSSTLINNISQWLGLNPFDLHSMISKGSGYDIACASAESPIIFQGINNKRVVNPVKWRPFYLQHLNLVYLNKKMPTENSVKQFLNQPASFSQAVKVTNEVTNQLLQFISFEKFEELMELHEKIIGQLLNLTPVKQRLFPDFNGVVKSLGAWGGDFILAGSKMPLAEQKLYFAQKGFSTFIPLSDLVLKSKLVK